MHGFLVQFFGASDYALRANPTHGYSLSRRSPPARVGPVNTTDASANEPLGVQGKADDAARTGRPGQEDNAAMRAGTFVPSGLPA